MSGAPNVNDQNLFRKFIGDKKILIADTAAASRAGIANLLVKMGATQNKLILVSSFPQAQETMNDEKPEIIITEYNLGKASGLNLIQQHRDQYPESRDSLFVIVTGDSSQSAVAQAAEEDVDTFVLKPYTADVLRMSILKAALAKKFPSDYALAIEKGKKLLEDKKIDEAIQTFDEAADLDPTPSLAHFYKGEAHTIKESLENAEGDYQNGLNHNKIHYKCMVGLFENTYSQKRYDEAYEVVKRISRYFPANPKRLTQVLRLAIMTSSYEDVERYYRIFVDMDERNDEMIKYICAALVVCGKYYLRQKSKSRAMELFGKAAISGRLKTNILREIVTALLEYNYTKNASEFLSKFPPEEHKSVDYLVSDFLVGAAIDKPSITVEKGRRLLKDDVNDAAIYFALIPKMLECNLADAAENTATEASKKYPDQKDQFMGLIPS